GACAVEAACGKTDQRHRALARIARLALAGDPMYALRPYRNAAFLAGCTFEQREIEFAAFELALQVGALVGAHVEPQRRMRARESREQFCQAIGGKILGYSEPHRAFA